MKLYDCTTAPSPRRVRIFAAEKGIELDKVQIDLANGAVTSVDWGAGGGTDLLVVGAQLWAATATGAVPVGENLMPETGSAIAIAGGTAYSAGTDGTHIIIGSYATFSEPGTVRVFTTDGTIVASALVGLGPGDMVYVSP